MNARERHLRNEVLRFRRKEQSKRDRYAELVRQHKGNFPDRSLSSPFFPPITDAEFEWFFTPDPRRSSRARAQQ